jgi:hypothetical protein
LCQRKRGKCEVGVRAAEQKAELDRQSGEMGVDEIAVGDRSIKLFFEDSP